MDPQNPTKPYKPKRTRGVVGPRLQFLVSFGPFGRNLMSAMCAVHHQSKKPALQESNHESLVDELLQTQALLQVLSIRLASTHMVR
jgi:hypothetical protein